MARTGRYEIDMCSGKLLPKILTFALPLMCSSVLQLLFNAADIVVVGKFAGDNSLAAVGSNAALINLMVNLFVGLSVGANILAARYTGAGNREGLRQTVHTSMLLALLSGILLAVVGVITARPLLHLMQVPDSILPLAALYLRIYFLGMPAAMLYNFGAALLRSVGDTRRPLYYLIAAGIVNVALNLLLVIVFQLDVAGVAIATVLADVVGAGMLFHYLRRETGPVRVELSQLKLDRKLAGAILYTGIPAAVQGMMFNIANVIIQTGFNRLGSQVVAASTIGVTAEIFVYYLVNSFGQASMTFTGQNYGAGNLTRCRQATKWCLLLGVGLGEAFSLLLVVFGLGFAGLYTTDGAIALLALTRMKWILPFEGFNTIIEILSGTLRGLGYSLVPTILCAAFICGLRILWIKLIFPLSPTFLGLLLVYPASWIAASAALAVAYVVVKKKVLQARVALEQ